MSWPLWCEIVCGACADTVAGRHNADGLNKAWHKKQAKKAGWELIGENWYCRACKDPDVRRKYEYTKGI